MYRKSTKKCILILIALWSLSNAKSINNSTTTIENAIEYVNETVAKETDEVAKETDEVAKETDEVAKETDEVAKETDEVTKATEDLVETTTITNNADYNDTKTLWSRFDQSIPSEDLEINQEAGANRQKRFLILSMINHQMNQAVRMSPAFPYRNTLQNDGFEFLRDNYPPPIGGVQKSYDFVVIGAGSAGSVIASRLSEGGKFSVLLLEAGGPEDLLTQVPIIAAYYQSTNYNWGYKMEKQEGICRGMKGQRCSWPRGKAIGGTSVINYMIYTRGNKIDWDRIAADGNPGWSYEDVLPYYLKSERAQNLDGYEDTENHNKYGLLGVEYAPYRSKITKAFLKAAKQKGHQIKTDYNDGNTTGFARIQSTTKYGWRESAAKAFLSPFKTRANLHVLPFSRVTKINIKNSTQTATSVEYIRNNIKYKVKAKKEIILSAGTFGSAQLLMLSGVGPKEHLEEIGIPVIKDLPVGKIMYDHFCFQGLQFLVNCTDCTTTETKILNADNILDWFKFGRGPMTPPGSVEGLGYIKTKISDELVNYPDIELLFTSGGITSDASHAIMKGMNIDEDFFEEAYGDIVEKPVFSIIPMMVHPKSKGYMKLKDKDPFHWPKFYYDYFSDRRDMQTLIEAIKYAIELSETKAFQKYGAELYNKSYPDCEQHEFKSDDYWECAIRTIGTTLHHQIGTCKMGPVDDPEAVVDNELKVHGIKRLRVADASIIPRPITAHTNAPTIMIGEKLADIVKETWI